MDGGDLMGGADREPPVESAAEGLTASPPEVLPPRPRLLIGALIAASVFALATVAFGVAWRQEVSSNGRLRQQISVWENEWATQRAQAQAEEEAVETIEGTMTLTDYSELWREGQSCTGSGGYDDIHRGAQVRITDGKGDLLAVGDLGGGTSPSLGQCEFPFSVGSVPRADFYEIEVSQRGGITYPHDELEAQGWAVDLTLG